MSKRGPKVQTNGASNGASNGTHPLSRAELLAKDSRVIIDFVVPELAGSVRIRSLELDDVLALEDVRAGGNGADYTRELVRLSLVDESGGRLSQEEMVAFSNRNLRAYRRIAKRVVADLQASLDEADSAGKG